MCNDHEPRTSVNGQLNSINTKKIACPGLINCCNAGPLDVHTLHEGCL